MSHYYDRADVTVSHEFYAFSYTKIIEMLVGHWGFILYYLCEPFCTPHILLGHDSKRVEKTKLTEVMNYFNRLVTNICTCYQKDTQKANTKRVCMDS